jgi:hypothetical protein
MRRDLGNEKIGYFRPLLKLSREAISPKESGSKTKPAICGKVEGYRSGIANKLADLKGEIGGPDRDRTDDLFHAIEKPRSRLQTVKDLQAV